MKKNLPGRKNLYICKSVQNTLNQKSFSSHTQNHSKLNQNT
jgi:3-methyladenine DNA glycosylase AlkC